MATVLKLGNFGTQRAIRSAGLHQRKRLGRGTFCAVYEGDANTVLKLTADPKQRESLVFYLKDPVFPRLVEDHGYAGTQGDDMDLWLLETERLTSLRTAPKELKKEARALIAAVDAALSAHNGIIQGHRSRAHLQPERHRRAVLTLLENASMASYHEAFAQVLLFMRDYDGVLLDVHSGNLMVRDGSQLVLNDIVCDSSYLS